MRKTTPEEQALTRNSWNRATRAHNSHKGDQAAFLRGGGDVLFDDELHLLGSLGNQKLAHLQCNSGQDTLCLARRGARCTGVDFSSEAIQFARQLSLDSKIDAKFVEAELLQWLHSSDADSFDLAFSSYGTVGWLPDLNRWATGIERILKPGGRFVLVEFHPLIWSIDDAGSLTRDDYFSRETFREPVQDYVADSGVALGAVDAAPPIPNETPAASWQYGVGEVVSALAGAGLQLKGLHEYPHSNGYKANPKLVPDGPRRWVWPAGSARVPLMYALDVQKGLR